MTQHFGDGRDWFFEKRFGLFVHWGIYAIPAWHEQILWRRGLDPDEYEKLIHQFNPTRFDPDEWLDLAEEAGMSFVCLTAKHVDGFCMFDTACHDYNIMNTPFGKDIVGMLADACHRRGFPLCLYYSIPDLHHPNFPHAGRAYEFDEPRQGSDPDLHKYLAFVREQVRELCSNYGEIHGIWWDANKLEHEDPSFNEMIRALQPNAVINGRGFDQGDYDLWERDYHGEVNAVRAFERPTQACQSCGRESWGFREDEDYYTVKYLIQSIDRMMAKGASYLLNVGPMADGRIADKDAAILRRIGQWYATVRESLDDAEPASHLTENEDILLTRKGDTLYVHLFSGPAVASVTLHPLDILPRRATLLNTGQELDVRSELIPRFFRAGKDILRIRELPTDEMAATVMVLKLEFDKLPEPAGAPAVENDDEM